MQPDSVKKVFGFMSAERKLVITLKPYALRGNRNELIETWNSSDEFTIADFHDQNSFLNKLTSLELARGFYRLKVFDVTNVAGASKCLV